MRALASAPERSSYPVLALPTPVDRGRGEHRWNRICRSARCVSALGLERISAMRCALVDIFRFMILLTNDALARVDDDARAVFAPLVVRIGLVDSGA